MNTTDKKIADVLAKFGEPMAGNVWRVQGTAVIYHKALERIAAFAKITFEPPTIIRSERDEAVILVAGRMGDRVEWSIGEALIGANYRVSGKQAAYVYAMAEKRAKDRVILKLIELSGEVYSEDEADEFKQGAASPANAPSSEPTESQRLIYAALGLGIEKASNTTELDLFKEEDIKPQMPAMTEEQQSGIMALYKDRYRSLLNRRAA